MIKLSERLSVIARNVDVPSTVVDIGCDHGYLGIYLLNLNKNFKIINVDINKNALANAKINKEKYKKTNNFELRCGDGLDVISEDEVDNIVIAGMGARSIIGIVSKNINKLKNVNKIIIQSNTDLFYVRKKMNELGFIILNEDLIKDKFIYYTIITFVKGSKKYNLFQLFFGPSLILKNEEIFIEKNKSDLKKLKEVYSKIPIYKLRQKLKIKKIIKLYNKLKN